ncbi:transposase, partial [Pseudoalteromonas prydzensis]
MCLSYFSADVKYVGHGDKALTYLARYLYRGVINEQNIIENQHGNVTFRY